jgi:hypothetical protein
MEEADTLKKKIDAVKAKELTGLTASRQIISTPGVFKSRGTGTGGSGANTPQSGDTPRRTPMRLGL